MIRKQLTAALAASTLLLSAAGASAQVQGGSQGGAQGRNVSASTYGTGTVDPNGVGVTGGGEARAVDGSASTRSDARFNKNRAVQRSVAEAQTEEERARSRTRTTANQRTDTVRSRTTSIYKADGQRAERETVRTVTTPEGTKTVTGTGRPDREERKDRKDRDD